MARALDGFSRDVLDALQRIRPVVGRRMFGGLGLYAQGVFFGLVHRDRLYFKVDDETRGSYVSRGMEPFEPSAKRKTTFSYYELPPDVLEDGRSLKTWVEQAVAAAVRTHASKGLPKRGSEREPRADRRRPEG